MVGVSKVQNATNAGVGTYVLSVQFKLVLLCFCLFASSPVLEARQIETGETLSRVSTAPLNYGQRLVLHSTRLDSDISLNVYLPENFYAASEDHRYPIIFIDSVHGEAFFHALTGVVKHLSSVDRMPETIVVSLNDGGYSPEVYLNGMWKHTTQEKFGADGDSESYVTFFKEELIPYFEKQYRALNYRMIIGVSVSSLFPLYTFSKAPELFQAHIFLAAADMLGMGLEKNKTFIDEIVKSMQKTPGRKAAFYLGMADADMVKDVRYKEVLDELNQRLTPFAHKELKLKIEVIPNEGHYDAFIKAMLSAIELIYPKQKWSPNYRDLIAQPGDAMQNIDNFYARLSKEYGFTVLPRATRWRSVNDLGHTTLMLLQQDRAKEAITVAKRWIQYRPKSADAYSGLANAFEANGNIGEAITAQKKALELAMLYDKNAVSEFESRLKELQTRPK